VPPPRITDRPFTLDKEPLEGKEKTAVTGQTEKPQAQKSPAPKDQIPIQKKKRQLAWIEIELVDQEGKPVPNEVYRVQLASGLVREGLLDHRGNARISGIEPGTCKVSFPAIHPDEWEKA